MLFRSLGSRSWTAEAAVITIWTTSQNIFSKDISKDADAIRKESNRRIRLFDDEDDNAKKYGNIIHIIG